jgi:hypothetical protein
MNKEWREALDAIGPNGATPDEIGVRGVSEQLLQQLLVAGLLRVHRLNHAESYGTRSDKALGSISAYMLTPTGAAAIGIDSAESRRLRNPL